MAQSPQIGITDEELYEELKTELENYSNILKAINVYSDVGENIEQIEKGDLSFSKKNQEITESNVKELIMKKIEEQCSFTRIDCLYSLLQKYHPNSPITDKKILSSFVEDARGKFQTSKEKLRNVV